MADEEIVAGLGRVESQLVQQRTEDSKQTSQLSETINSLRAENSQKSDNLANVITTGLERNASELASDRAILQENQSFLRETGITQVDDKVDNLTTATTTANTEQKTFLQQIATFVSPNNRGSKDREEQNETLLNRKKQLQFFSNMSKSLKGMVVKPLRATTAGIWTFLKGLAMGGVVLAILNFLDSETWKEMQKSIAEDLPRMLEELKEAFFGKEGGFINGLKKLAEILGFDEKDAENLKFIKDHWGKIAIGLIALAAITPAILFGGAWRLGRWIFIAPLAALFAKLAGLPGAMASGGLGTALKPPARPVPGVTPRTFTAGGQQYQVGPAPQPPPGTVGPTRPIVTPVSPGLAQAMGSAGVSPAIQAKGESRLNPQGGWQKFMERMKFSGQTAKWIGRLAKGAGLGMLGWNLWDIWKPDSKVEDKVKATVGQLVGYRAAVAGAMLAGGAIAAGGFPLWATIGGSVLAGGAAFYAGDMIGQYLYEMLFGKPQSGKSKTFAEGVKAQDAAENLGIGTEMGAAVPPMATAKMPSPVKLAAAVPTSGFEGAMDMPTAIGSAGNDTLGVTPLPTSGAAVAAAGTGLNAASRAATSSIATGGGAPIVNAPNIVNTTTSNTTVESKKISNASGILHALNYAYG